MEYGEGEGTHDDDEAAGGREADPAGSFEGPLEKYEVMHCDKSYHMR